MLLDFQSLEIQLVEIRNPMGENPKFEAIGIFFIFCLNGGMVEFMVTTEVEMEIHET